MKQGCFPLIAAVLLSAAGCSNARQNAELLERDSRWQEDEIYYLQEQLNEYEQRLDSCRRENASLKKELGVTDGRSYNPRKDLPSSPSGKRGSPKSDGPDLQLPSVELPAMPSEAPSRKPASGDSAAYGPSLLPASAIPISTGRLVSSEEKPADDVITQVVLNKMLTGGHNIDRHAGDDGILVVFEPRNAAGQLVPTAGETSIVLLDPTLDGEAARIARWDFATDEVVPHFKKLILTKGFEFDLRWPNQPPRNPNLKLYVRFITPEGKRLVAEKDLHLRLAGSDEKSNWVRSDEDKTDGGNRDSGASARPPLTAQRLGTSGDPAAPAWKPFR